MIAYDVEQQGLVNIWTTDVEANFPYLIISSKSWRLQFMIQSYNEYWTIQSFNYLQLVVTILFQSIFPFIWKLFCRL